MIELCDLGCKANFTATDVCPTCVGKVQEPVPKVDTVKALVGRIRFKVGLTGISLQCRL